MAKDLRGFPIETTGAGDELMSDFERKKKALDERQKKGKAEEPVVQAVLKSYLSRKVGEGKVKSWLKGGALKTNIGPGGIGD